MEFCATAARRINYRSMVQLIGQMGAFERARIATNEIIAKQARDEALARERIAETVKIIKTLSEAGLISTKDEEYVKQVASVAARKKYNEVIDHHDRHEAVVNPYKRQLGLEAPQVRFLGHQDREEIQRAFCLYSQVVRVDTGRFFEPEHEVFIFDFPLAERVLISCFYDLVIPGDGVVKVDIVQ